MILQVMARNWITSTVRALSEVRRTSKYWPVMGSRLLARPAVVGDLRKEPSREPLWGPGLEVGLVALRSFGVPSKDYIGS